MYHSTVRYDVSEVIPQTPEAYRLDKHRVGAHISAVVTRLCITRKHVVVRGIHSEWYHGLE